MPTFVVIGAAKSGTTALYSYLGQHPDVYVPAVEEPSWFSFADQTLDFTGPSGIRPGVNERAFTQRDAYEALFADAAPGQARGDVSPVYLYWPGTAERLASEVPNARLVVLLRHPVDRAYSAFMHARREEREPLHDFRDALAAEAERIAENCGFLWRYRDLGRYGPQLRRWLNVFPREQLFIATFDDFAADPGEVCRRVQAFIGVDDTFTPDTSVRHNVSGLPRNRLAYALTRSDTSVSRMARRLGPLVGIDRLKRAQRGVRSRLLRRVGLDPDLRADLIEEWRPDIDELIDAVDIDIHHWLTPRPPRVE